MTSEIPYTRLPLDPADVRYVHGPDSAAQDGVPRGTVTEMAWNDSSVYPGTSRTIWVYVPATYDAADPASLLVLQDGGGFLDPEDDFRGAVVLDNLIHRADLRATIAVFVDPGVRTGGDVPLGGRNQQRNAEYDAFDDRYVTFLLTEILPEVTGRWAVTDDHDRWGIGGFSSGGSCAFTAAWFRPDTFRRVLAFLPSFPQMPGGNPYPALIAEEPRRPLRIFLQAASRDLGWDEAEDNWLAEDLRVAAALTQAAYDVRLVVGDGGHDSNHAGVLLPDALRWTFRPH